MDYPNGRRGDSVEEHWERIIENEIFFYINFDNHKASLEGFLHELEYEFDYPGTHYDHELGIIRMKSIDVENQAIRRIEKKEGLEKLLVRAEKRKERFENIYKQLNQAEKNVIRLLYFENRRADYQTYKKKIPVLKKLFSFYKAYREKGEARATFAALIRAEIKGEVHG